MSITLMSLAWKSALAAGRKMVLLALCDWANEQGECYPSVSTLALKCSMGERTVQGHIADMEEMGIIRRVMRNGRSTFYHINVDAFPTTPAESAPPQNPHPTPANPAGAPPQKPHPTPAAAAPISTTEPPSKPPPKSAPPRGSRLAQDWTLPDEWKVWAIEQRPGITEAQVLELADGFRDYWVARPGQGGVKLDWLATWRNWVRNARQLQQSGGAAQWWIDDESTLAKGRELSLTPNRGESMPQFRGRIRQALERPGTSTKRAPQPTPPPTAPPAPPEAGKRSAKPEGIGDLKSLVRKDVPRRKS